MSEEKTPGLLDHAVRALSRAMDGVGLNGRRLLWKWEQRRRHLGEAGMRTEMFWRSAQGKHKMCPSCRALVPRSASACDECGHRLATVRAPGIGRMFSNLLPGISAATSLLLLVNGFWFLIMLLAQMKLAQAGGVGGFSVFGFDSELIVRFGSGLSRPRMLPGGEVTGGEWWRIVTPIFLHGGLLHFFFNSYMLLQLGPIVEEIWGTERFWVIYLASGLVGSLSSQLPRFVNTVGASGAIMGLIGLLLVYGLRSGGVLGQTMKSMVVRLGLYMVVLSFFFNLDHFNHAGGFVAGAAAALLVPAGPSRGRVEATVFQALSVAGVLLVVVAFYKVAAQGALSPGS